VVAQQALIALCSEELLSSKESVHSRSLVDLTACHLSICFSTGFVIMQLQLFQISLGTPQFAYELCRLATV
jgi:hypothetical protein